MGESMEAEHRATDSTGRGSTAASRAGLPPGPEVEPAASRASVGSGAALMTALGGVPDQGLRVQLAYSVQRTHGNAFHTKDLYNPEINIRYGAWYLDNLFRKYGTERLVLAAYNAGQGNVDRWRARGMTIQFSETKAYVSRVEDLKRIYRDAWRSKLYQ